MKVLIVDDSVLFRILLKNLLRNIQGIEVVGTASDGEFGLHAIENKKPDVVLLDVEMPKLTGLDVMKQVNLRKLKTNVIMCSAFTLAGADVTVKALELGAHDFITKPEGKDKEQSIKLLKDQLLPVIEELKILNNYSATKVKAPIINKEVSKSSSKKIFADIVGIGVSTGGPKALVKVLPEIPGNFKLPIVIVQHMPKLFIESMATSLDGKCDLKVKVGEHGEVLNGGCVYIAPGEIQMAVVKQEGSYSLSMSNAPPENYCKPAVDYLFRSLANVSGKKSIGIVMTGMGGDGAKGLLEIKNKGGYTITQSEESCTIYGMPKEAVKLGASQSVIPLGEIAQHLVQMTQ